MKVFLVILALMLPTMAHAYKKPKIIVDKLEWTGVQVNESIAELIIPRMKARCMAFFLERDKIITSHHCVPKRKYARKAYIRWKDKGQTIKCTKFLGTSRRLDYTILRCKGERPPLVVAPIPYKPGKISIVHRQCDYELKPRCKREWVESLGKVTKVSLWKFQHDADTLGGSSGAPVLNADGKVIGIHSGGMGGDRNQRGDYNEAIIMSKILEHFYERR